MGRQGVEYWNYRMIDISIPGNLGKNTIEIVFSRGCFCRYIPFPGLFEGFEFDVERKSDPGS